MRRQSVIYISEQAHHLLKMLAARRDKKLGVWVEDVIFNTAVRELGDEVHKVLADKAEQGIALSGEPSNPSQGHNGSMGETKEREDILGS